MAKIVAFTGVYHPLLEEVVNALVDVEEGEEAAKIWNAIADREQRAMRQRGIPEDVVNDWATIAGQHWSDALDAAWRAAAKSGGAA
jgi:hypothetical protein